MKKVLPKLKTQKNEFEFAISKMYTLIKKSKGFPVACVFINKKKEIIVAKANKKSEFQITDHKNHAEFQCLQKINNSPQKIIAIITLVPCSGCCSKMKKNKNITWDVYYIYDAIWDKENKQYIQEFKQAGNRIHPFEFSNLGDDVSKSNYYYCLWRLRDRIKIHAFSKINKEKYTKTIKKLNTKLRKIKKYEREDCK